MRKISHYINGRIVSGESGKQSSVFNPASGEPIAVVDLASTEEVAAAVSAAKTAFPAWSATTPLNRARVMFKFKELLEANRNQLESMICSEHGKVLSDAGGELSRGLEVVEFACGIPHLLKGEHSSNVGANVDSWSEMQPLGVVAGITPFNFPAMVPMWMFPIALSCGNTFILKPSERDPSPALRIAELLSKAGLPDGVFNVVNGDKTAVDALITHDDVEAVSFVGSTPIAEYVYSTASKYGKRAQALGGAKNHMMIMQDADLDQAADAVMGAAYGSAGERCMAISVAVCVGDDVADRFIEKLSPRVRELIVRPGTEDNAEVGPLISSGHLDRVKSFVQQGVDAGASLLVDGRDITVTDYEGGYFIGGCLFDHVTADMSIYKEEIFGPVLCIVRVADFESGCKLINDHQYGNGTAIFTRDGDCARQFTHRIQAGMVGVNVSIPVPMAFHSFGGWKRSIFGSLNVHGPDGVRFYTRMKTITARWPTGIRAGTEYSMPLMK